ncbi:hypothetical protein NVIRENTERO_00001 [Sodalis praecaptivus]|nr:hypothetical protein NVIRENTERO_00001 [Sodalis praecaptivus]
MSPWFLERDDTALPTITQFDNDIKPQAEICTDIYRQNITFYTPYLGTLTLKRSPTRAKIVSAVFSPNYGWMAIHDEERYIALYQLSAPERIYTDSFEKVIAPGQRLKAPDDFDFKRVALSFIDNKGKYFYANAVSWRNAVDKHYLWQPENGYSPLFVSPEHDFMGYANEDDATISLFQAHRRYSISMKIFNSTPTQGKAIAVAFSPLNALVAVAFNDDFVYVYNIVDAKANAIIYPLLYIDLKRDVFSEHALTSNLPKSVVLRFEGIFTHLKVIHNVYNASLAGDSDDSTYVYQRFLLSP